MTLIDKIAWIRLPDTRGYLLGGAPVRSTYWLWVF